MSSFVDARVHPQATALSLGDVCTDREQSEAGLCFASNQTRIEATQQFVVGNATLNASKVVVLTTFDENDPTQSDFDDLFQILNLECCT